MNYWFLVQYCMFTDLIVFCFLLFVWTLIITNTICTVYSVLELHFMLLYSALWELMQCSGYNWKCFSKKSFFLNWRNSASERHICKLNSFMIIIWFGFYCNDGRPSWQWPVVVVVTWEWRWKWWIKWWWCWEWWLEEVIVVDVCS